MSTLAERADLAGGARGGGPKVARRGRRRRQRWSSTSTWPGRAAARRGRDGGRAARRAGRRGPAGRRAAGHGLVCGRRPAARRPRSRSGPAEAGLAEERVIRGMHPLTGQRLRPLAAEELQRHPAAVAPRTPTCSTAPPARTRPTSGWSRWPRCATSPPLRDADGHVARFPSAERVLAACLESIRRAQAERPGRRRLDANQVFLYVWPPIEVPLRELIAVAQRLAPLTVGIGLEEICCAAPAADGADGALGETALRFTLPARRRRDGRAGADPPDRAARAARRLHPEGAGRPPPRHGLPVRDRAA